MRARFWALAGVAALGATILGLGRLLRFYAIAQAGHEPSVECIHFGNHWHFLGVIVWY